MWSNKRTHPNERRHGQRPPCCHSWRHWRWQRNGQQTNQLSGRIFTHNLGNSPIVLHRHMNKMNSCNIFFITTASCCISVVSVIVLLAYICWHWLQLGPLVQWNEPCIYGVDFPWCNYLNYLFQLPRPTKKIMSAYSLFRLHCRDTIWGLDVIIVLIVFVQRTLTVLVLLQEEHADC